MRQRQREGLVQQGSFNIQYGVVKQNCCQQKELGTEGVALKGFSDITDSFCRKTCIHYAIVPPRSPCSLPAAAVIEYFAAGSVAADSCAGSTIL